MKQPICTMLFIVVCAALSGCLGTYFGTAMPDKLQREGVSADATIMKIWDTGWTLNDNPVIGMQVEVHPADRPTFAATIKRYVVSRIGVSAYQPGNVIRMRFDPSDLSSIAVDSERSPQSTDGAVSNSLRSPSAVRSLRSDTPALMTFVNETDQPVDVYWIDFGGQRQLYKTLEPGGSFTQQTYLTHPWLVTDAHGRSWDVYLPEARPRTIHLRAQSE